MTDTTTKNGQKSEVFNPFAWGILFFSLWLSIQMFNELSTLQQGIGWFFLGLSTVLFLSIFIRPLWKLLSRPGLSSFFISLIFFAPILGFTITLAQSWPNLAVPHLLYISIAGGVVWLIAYLLILIRIVAELKRVGLWAGIAICIIIVGIGIYEAITSDVLAGTMLIALGIGATLIVIKKPPIWHKLPF